jgi:hypothetical protein
MITLLEYMCTYTYGHVNHSTYGHVYCTYVRTLLRSYERVYVRVCTCVCLSVYAIHYQGDGMGRDGLLTRKRTALASTS